MNSNLEDLVSKIKETSREISPTLLQRTFTKVPAEFVEVPEDGLSEDYGWVIQTVSVLEVQTKDGRVILSDAHLDLDWGYLLKGAYTVFEPMKGETYHSWYFRLSAWVSANAVEDRAEILKWAGKEDLVDGFQASGKQITYWLYYRNHPIFSIRGVEGLTDDQVREIARKQNEKVPLPHVEYTPYELGILIQNSEIRTFPDGV
jgi:hypothetical protein